MNCYPSKSNARHISITPWKFAKSLGSIQYVPIFLWASFSPHSLRTMTVNGILSFVIYLSLRSQIAGRSHSTRKLRFQALAFLAALHLRSWYKFICRSVTGCGAIERLCRTALGDSDLWINEGEMEIRSGEMRRLVWWIGRGLCNIR